MAMESNAKKMTKFEGDDVEYMPTNESVAEGAFDRDAAKLAGKYIVPCTQSVVSY